MLPIVDSILGIANKFIPDSDARNKLEKELQSKMEDTLKAAVDADKSVRIAELNAGGLAAKWRPLAAISVFATLFLHWFILPIWKMIVVGCDLDVWIPQLEPLPMEYYGLAIAFISVYAYGRSREKEVLNLMRK